jgi:hypothetical protein
MKVKILLAAIVAGVFLLYAPGCVKHNAVELSAGGCDTSNVSYSTQVVAVLENNCYTCHKGAGASSGVDFSSYDAFKGWAGSTPYLIGDITHTPGYTPMPYGLPKLSDCDVNTILAWIHQGMQNN